MHVDFVVGVSWAFVPKACMTRCNLQRRIMWDGKECSSQKSNATTVALRRKDWETYDVGGAVDSLWKRVRMRGSRA